MEIPIEAMPVVEVLRRDVPRPTALLIMRSGPRFECGKCPMGLHPTALNDTPSTRYSFTGGSPLCEMNHLTLEATSPGFAFWQWWDKLTLAQAYEAVDLIWAPEAGSKQ